MIGVGGNLVAVQASRLSTALYQQSKLKNFRHEKQYHNSTNYPNPCHIFYSNGMKTLSCVTQDLFHFSFLENDLSTIYVLLGMTLLGHLIFLFTIAHLTTNHAQFSFAFVVLYVIAVLVQVRNINHE